MIHDLSARSWAFLLALGLVVTAAVSPVRAEVVSFPGARSSNQNIYPVAATVQGTLLLPPNAPANQRLPAVVLLHGSGGVDGRGAFHGQGLREAGFATLELDMFQAGQRPPQGSRMTMSHAYGALKFLASHPRIDAQRIGAMGFSWGANMGLRIVDAETREAFAADIGPLDFKAVVSFYPVCHLHQRLAAEGRYQRLTGAPLWLAIGSLDDYGDTAICREFVTAMNQRPGGRMTFTLYPNATHGWDSPANLRRTVYDPVAFGGRGGQVRFWPDRALAERSREEAVAFFRQHLMAAVPPAPAAAAQPPGQAARPTRNR